MNQFHSIFLDNFQANTAWRLTLWTDLRTSTATCLRERFSPSTTRCLRLGETPRTSCAPARISRFALPLFLTTEMLMCWVSRELSSLIYKLAKNVWKTSAPEKDAELKVRSRLLIELYCKVRGANIAYFQEEQSIVKAFNAHKPVAKELRMTCKIDHGFGRCRSLGTACTGRRRSWF